MLPHVVEVGFIVFRHNPTVGAEGHLLFDLWIPCFHGGLVETSYNVEEVQAISVGDCLHINGEDHHQGGWCLTLPLLYHLRVELN